MRGRPSLVDVALPARLAVGVGAGVGRVGEHAVDLVVGGRRPTRISAPLAAPAAGSATPSPRSHSHTCRAPSPARRSARRSSAIAPRTASSGCEQDLAVLVAPDQPDRQAAAQLAARGLVADPALQPRAQHVQLGLAHRPLQPEHQPVVERRPGGRCRRRRRSACRSRPHRSSSRYQSALLRASRETSRPSTIPTWPSATSAARRANPTALDCPRAREAEVLVDHLHLLAREAELDAPARRARTGASVDSTLRSSCAGVDWRTYTNACRRRCDAVSFERSLTVRVLARDRLCDHGRQLHQCRPALLLAEQLPQRRRRRRALPEIESQLQPLPPRRSVPADHPPRPGRHAGAGRPAPAGHPAGRPARPASPPAQAAPAPPDQSTPPGSANGCHPGAPAGDQASHGDASNPPTRADGPPMDDAHGRSAPPPGSRRGGQCVVSSFEADRPRPRLMAAASPTDRATARSSS